MCFATLTELSRETVQPVKGHRAQYSAKCVVLVDAMFQQFILNICGPNGNLLFQGTLLFLYPDPWTLVTDILCPAVFV